MLLLGPFSLSINSVMFPLVLMLMRLVKTRLIISLVLHFNFGPVLLNKQSLVFFTLLMLFHSLKELRYGDFQVF